MKYNIKASMLVFVLFLNIGFSQNLEIFFDKGNELYNKGEYELAIVEYNKILNENMHSSELYFNMGNSYYKLNRVAECNYYYEKALILSPKNKDILENLSYAKNMTLDSIEELPKTQFQEKADSIISFFSLSTWAFISIGLMFVFLVIAMLYLFSLKPLIKRVYFSLSLILLFTSFVISTFIWSESKKIDETKMGIIFSKELSVFSEPNNRNEEIFILHEGTKVQILDQLTGWEKIKLNNGSEGWVIKDQIKKL